MTAWNGGAMASREELLQGIRPGLRLDRPFFLKVYGYELTWPGFAETAIKALETAGCIKARDYYDLTVREYEAGYRRQVKEVGAWYLEECEREWKRKQKGSEEQRIRKELKQYLDEKSDRELLNLLQVLS